MKSILVIEDQPQMLRNLAMMLGFEGYQVFTAENGKLGVEIATAQVPDLIICDVMMPELDGHGVIQALRANPATATIPFIFLTARSDRGDIRTGMNAGADDYLVKPVPRQELLAAVEARFVRSEAVEARILAAASSSGFHPDFSTHEPLVELGLTNREAEVLLWVAQGKSNADVAAILGMSEKTVKQHLGTIFGKLGVENRNAAALRAIEVLAGPKGH